MQTSNVLEKPSADTGSARIHLDFLDGLRGLAALYVMLCHMYLSQFGMAARPGLRGLAGNWLLYGHLAVDVFIVLSGFCLAIRWPNPGKSKAARPSS